MSLTRRQEHELCDVIIVIVQDLDRAVKHLDYLSRLRSTGGPDVKAVLDAIYPEGDVSLTRFLITSRGQVLKDGLLAYRGVGLGDKL